MKKFLLAVFLFPLIVNGQDWIKHLPQEKKSNYTFYEIQQAFNQYLDEENIVDGKKQINGDWIKVPNYKQFKRWEWYWESRINPQTGEFPDLAAIDAYYDLKTKSSSPKAEASSWTALGPDWSSGGYAGIGRINTVAFPPDDYTNIYVGAPSGGLWKFDGSFWSPLTDQNTVLGVSDIAFNSDFSTSNTMYIATGDRDGGSMWSLGGSQYNDNNSIGVLKSNDGGSTWSVTGLTFDVSQNARVGRLLIDPNNDNILYAATSFGIYKTTDAGANWTIMVSGYHVIDMEFMPNNPDVVYGSTYNRSGEPRIIYTNDAGVNWYLLKTFTAEASRIELAVTPADSLRLYALVSNSSGGFYGFFKSTDGAATIDSVTTTNTNTSFMGYYSDGSGDNTGQGNYDLCIAASPSSANEVFIGGINTWKSTDGGVSWSIGNMWTSSSTYNMASAPVVHADKHVLKYRGDGVLFEGNDGGIYETANTGTSWDDLSDGLVISQMYRIGVSQTDYNITLTGLQDNGTKLLDETGWTDVYGGDGMECIVDYADPNVQYNTYVRGEIHRTTDYWSSLTTISDNIPTSEQGHWVTPYIIDPNTNTTLYVGYDEVYKTTNRGDSFTQISSFGNTANKLRSMAIAPSNSSVLYVAFLDQIWKTIDGGSSWTDITGTLPVSSNSITYIAVKNTDQNTLWVSFGGYNTQRVYESTDGGSTWLDISTGLPNLPVMSIVYNKEVSSLNQLYAGTDVGVFVKNGTENWTPFDNNLPNVVVTELEIYYNENYPDSSRLRAATYGRGLWESPLLTVTSNIPVVETYDATNITTDFATLNGSIVTDNGFTITKSGFIYSTNPGAFLGDTGADSLYTNPISTSGNFAIDISGLQEGTTYYYKAFAMNSEGLSYGAEIAFTTECLPITSLPFSENFSSAGKPLCWNVTDEQGNGQVWRFDNPNSYTFASSTGDNGFAIIDSDYYGSEGSQNTALVSPTFDFTNYSTVNVSFEHHFANYDGSDGGEFNYSTDGGATWTNIQYFDNADFGSLETPTLQKYDLTSQLAGVSNVKFAWQYSGVFALYWLVDDFKVYETPVTEPNVLFDPATVDVGTLPAGFEIVTEDSVELLKVAVDEWNQVLPIDDYNTEGYNKFMFNARVDPGTTGLSVDQLRAAVNLLGPNGSYTTGFPASSTLTEHHGFAITPYLINNIQFSVQSNADWSTALTGAFLYVGKITMYYEEPIVVSPPKTTTTKYINKEVVLNGSNDNEYVMETGGLINQVASGTVNGVTAGQNVEVTSNGDSYGQWISSYDENNLYFLMVVSDDDVIDMPAGTSTPYFNDGIEIFVDAKNRRFDNWPRIEGEQHQFRINVGTTSPLIGDNGMPGFFGDNDTTNITYFIDKQPPGYMVEVQIPWAAIFRTSSNTNQEALGLAATSVNTDLSIALAINLLDANSPDNQKSILCWSNNSGEDFNYRLNEFYGQLNLDATIPNLSINDIQYTESESGDSPFNGQEVETQGIVTAIDPYGYYLQDGPGEWNGIFVYDTLATAAVGDEVLIIATVAEYSGLTELDAIVSTEILSSGNALPVPETISVMDANEEAYESVLVKLTNVKAGDGLTQYNEWYVYQEQDRVFVDDRLFFYDPVPYNYYDISGILSYAFNSYRVYPRSVADITDLGAVPGDVYWYEDFDGSVWSSSVQTDSLGYAYNGTVLPNNFSVVDSTGNNYFWHWSDIGPRGAYTQGNDNDWATPANDYLNLLPPETTIENGFMMLESDYYNTLDDGSMDPNYIGMNSYVQFGPIDLTSAPSAIITFKYLYRYCCNTGNTFSLFVSNNFSESNPDAAVWEEFKLNENTNPNDYPNNRIFEANVSTTAAGQSTVYFRIYQKDASHYFWIVDDIYIHSAPENDLILNDTWAHYDKVAGPDEISTDISYNFYGGYTSIPQKMVSPFVRFDAAIENNGTLTQNGTAMNISLYRNGFNYNNLSSSPISVAPNQRDTIRFETAVEPLQLGNYDIAVELVADASDENPGDNSWLYSFEVDKYTYSRVRRGQEYLFGNASPRDWASGGYEGDFMGQIYDIPETSPPAKLNGISVFVDRYSGNADAIAAIEAGNFKMQAKVYKVDGSYIDMGIVSDMYTIQIADTGTWVDLRFIDEGNLFVDPGMYLVGIEAFTGSTGQASLYFRIGNDLSGTKQPAAGGIVHLTNTDNWFRSRENYAIDLYVNGIPGDGPELALNVDMTDATFTQGTDMVYISGSYFAWVEPGLDKSLMLRDFDGDNIYSATFQVQPGTEFQYKYFINSGWAGGEWEGDPNRIVQMPENDVEVDDVFGVYDTGNNIISFAIPEQVIDAEIDNFNATVYVLVGQGTDLTSLTPTIEVSPGATINPASGVSRNFSSEVTYTVTSSTGTSKTWYVTVEESTGQNYNIEFEIMDDQAYVHGAEVNLDGEVKVTNRLGKVVFFDYLPANNIPYTISRIGYNDNQGSIDLVNQNLSIIINLNPLSVNKKVTNGVSVYPNPSGDIFYVENTSTNEIKEINVYNLNGQKVFTNNTTKQINEIVLRSTEPGVYIIQVIKEDRVVQFKHVLK